jgi:hypothetical protein
LTYAIGITLLSDQLRKSVVTWVVETSVVCFYRRFVVAEQEAGGVGLIDVIVEWIASTSYRHRIAIETVRRW